MNRRVSQGVLAKVVSNCWVDELALVEGEKNMTKKLWRAVTDSAAAEQWL